MAYKQETRNQVDIEQFMKEQGIPVAGVMPTDEHFDIFLKTWPNEQQTEQVFYRFGGCALLTTRVRPVTPFFRIPRQS